MNFSVKLRLKYVIFLCKISVVLNALAVKVLRHTAIQTAILRDQGIGK